MNSDLKFELKLRQLGTLIEHLGQYQAKGWTVMIDVTKKAILKLEAEIDALEG